MLTEKDHSGLTKIAETKNFSGLIRWIVPSHSHLKQALENTDQWAGLGSYRKIRLKTHLRTRLRTYLMTTLRYILGYKPKLS